MKKLLLALLAFALLFGASVALAGTIRCESSGGSYRSCPVDTRGGSVRLSRQLSSQGCWQNDTWGYDRNRIWVNRGCRAEFSIGGGSSDGGKVAAAVVLGVVAAAVIASRHNDNDNRYDNRYDYGDDYRDSYRNDGYDQYGGDPRRTFRCESTGGSLTYCSIPGSGEVEVFKQLSSSACQYGRSWGVSRRRVWVNHGCRADFAIF